MVKVASMRTSVLSVEVTTQLTGVPPNELSPRVELIWEGRRKAQPSRSKLTPDGAALHFDSLSTPTHRVYIPEAAIVVIQVITK